MALDLRSGAGDGGSVESTVRLSIEIDSRLLHRAMRMSGTRTKKAAVEAALPLLVDTYAQGSSVGFGEHGPVEG